MNFSQVRLTTKRLRLVPVSMKYAATIFKELTVDITHYMDVKTPEVIEETRKFIHENRVERKRREDLTFVVLKKSTGEFLGHAGTHMLHTKTPHLGVWIKKSAHGHHYGREAVTAAKRWVERNFKVDHLVYNVVRDNVASRKIAESLGGVVKKEFKKTTLNGKTWEYVEYWIQSSH